MALQKILRCSRDTTNQIVKCKLPKYAFFVIILLVHVLHFTFLGTTRLPQLNNVRGLKNFKPPVMYDRKYSIEFVCLISESY